jgi:uncharacterized protein (TIGR02147 family)
MNPGSRGYLTLKPAKRIYEYDSYREFLKDYYFAAKAKSKGFSFRVFSRMAGFKGGNVLKRVMDGDHNLAPESIEKFAKALKLNKEESIFFRSLVLLNQAANFDQKQIHAEEIIRLRGYKRVFPLKPIQYQLFAKWYLTVLHEMVTLAEFREDPEWIAARIYPPITAAEASRGINELLKFGLLERDTNGRLRQGNPSIATQDEITSSALAFYHREMMKRAGESIDRVGKSDRELTAMTFGASRRTANRLKELLNNFRKEAMDVIASDSGERDGVFQLNYYLFPLVLTGGGEMK